jgi:hypothetical protein
MAQIAATRRHLTGMKSFLPNSMRLQIRSILPLLAAVVLGACASANPEAVRTRNLLTAAGFHTVKPETPEQREIFSQMPAYVLEGGIIQAKQTYSYKDLGKGVVYVGGDTEFQQYEVLLARSKQANGSAPGQNMNPHKAMLGQQAFGYRGLWLSQDIDR